MKPETTYPAIIGRILARKRKEKGFDQAKISDLTGINRSSWSRIENGDANPNATQLAKIAEALGVTPQEIFTEAENARKQLIKKGVTVHLEANPKIQKTKGFGPLAMLGAAAVGALVATIAAQSKDAPPTSEEDDDSS